MKKILFLFLFYTQVTQGATNEYFVGNAGTNLWGTAACWASSSGGVGGSGHVPLSGDNAIFDANSKICYLDAHTNMRCLDLNCTGYIYSLNFQAGATLTCGRDAKFSPTMQCYGTDSANYLILTGSANTIDVDTVEIQNVSIRINDGASITPLNSIKLLGRHAGFVMTGGEFNNAFDVAFRFAGVTLDYDTNVSLTMGNATWEIYGSDKDFGFHAWDEFGGGAITLSSSASTLINFTQSNSFTGDTVSYSVTVPAYSADMQFNRGGSTKVNQILGSEYFQNLYDLGTAAHSLLCADGTTTLVFGLLDISGTAGNLITISTPGTSYVIDNQSGVPFCSDYINLSKCTSLTETFYAGCHSVDSGSNTACTFNDCGVACVTPGHKHNRIYILN